MRFDLSPPDGVGPLRIGMSLYEAQTAMEVWGTPRPYEEGTSLPVGSGWMMWSVDAMVMAYTKPDDYKYINLITLATPGYGVPTEDEVYCQDINTFLLPALEVIARLRGLGLKVVVLEEANTFYLPDIFFSLWRSGGPEGMEDGREKPVYFEAATIGDTWS